MPQVAWLSGVTVGYALHSIRGRRTESNEPHLLESAVLTSFTYTPHSPDQPCPCPFPSSSFLSSFLPSFRSSFLPSFLPSSLPSFLFMLFLSVCFSLYLSLFPSIWSFSFHFIDSYNLFSYFLFTISSCEKILVICRKLFFKFSYWVVPEVIADFFIKIKNIFLNTKNKFVQISLYWYWVSFFTLNSLIYGHIIKNVPAWRAHSHRALRAQLASLASLSAPRARDLIVALRDTRSSRYALRNFRTSRFALGLVLFAYV